MTRPRARSAATASRTTVRLTPMPFIISVSDGNFAPTGSFPDMIWSARRSTTSELRLLGAPTGRSSRSRWRCAASFGVELDEACRVIVQVIAQPRRAGKSARAVLRFVRPWAARVQMTPTKKKTGQENDRASTRQEEMMKRRDFMKLGAGFGAAGLAGTLPFEAAAQTKAVFKASDVQPPGYPTVVATENLGKKLSEATQGRLSVQMFPSMQLGGEKETIEQTQIGAIQMSRVSVGTMGPIVDDINVINMPFLFKNTAHANKMMDGEIGQQLLDKITASPNANLVALCWMDSGARSLYNSKHPIKSIEEIKGLKFRVIGNPIFVDMMNALGGNGVSMGYDQVFSALQTGVIDGAENNLPSYVFSNHYTVAKYYTLTQHLIVPEILVFSRKTWDTLSKDEIGLIRKLAREAQLEERDLWNKYESAALEKARANGNQIIEIPDKKPFQDAVKPVWDKYGPRFADVINRIQAVQ